MTQDKGQFSHETNASRTGTMHGNVPRNLIILPSLFFKETIGFQFLTNLGGHGDLSLERQYEG